MQIRAMPQGKDASQSLRQTSEGQVPPQGGEVRFVPSTDAVQENGEGMQEKGRSCERKMQTFRRCPIPQAISTVTIFSAYNIPIFSMDTPVIPYTNGKRDIKKLRVKINASCQHVIVIFLHLCYKY